MKSIPSFSCLFSLAECYFAEQEEKKNYERYNLWSCILNLTWWPLSKASTMYFINNWKFFLIYRIKRYDKTTSITFLNRVYNFPDSFSIGLWCCIEKQPLPISCHKLWIEKCVSSSTTTGQAGFVCSYHKKSIRKMASDENQTQHRNSMTSWGSLTVQHRFSPLKK